MNDGVRPTHVQDVQGEDVGRGGAQRIGRLHPHLVGGEEGQVAGDVAGVLLLRPAAVVCTLRLRLVPPALRRGPKVPGNIGQNLEILIPKFLSLLFIGAEVITKKQHLRLYFTSFVLQVCLFPLFDH